MFQDGQTNIKRVRGIYALSELGRDSGRAVMQGSGSDSVLLHHELRTFWIGRQATWKASQLVFLDESACNERTGDRKFGWAPIGRGCEVSCSIKRSERWSVLPALSVDGYLSYFIYQGSITAEIFELFVEQQVLPHCTPYPGPQSIIILDNEAIHK